MLARATNSLNGRIRQVLVEILITISVPYADDYGALTNRNAA
jgi:hypothetical protein